MWEPDCGRIFANLWIFDPTISTRLNRVQFTQTISTTHGSMTTDVWTNQCRCQWRVELVHHPCSFHKTQTVFNRVTNENGEKVNPRVVNTDRFNLLFNWIESNRLQLFVNHFLLFWLCFIQFDSRGSIQRIHVSTSYLEVFIRTAFYPIGNTKNSKENFTNGYLNIWPICLSISTMYLHCEQRSFLTELCFC